MTPCDPTSPGKRLHDDVIDVVHICVPEGQDGTLCHVLLVQMVLRQVTIDFSDEPLQCLAGRKHVVWNSDEVLSNGINGGLSAITHSQQVVSKPSGRLSLLSCT